MRHEEMKVSYFRAYGVFCAMVAAIGVNGYVQLPLFHPWRPLDLQVGDGSIVEVHGGITYGPDDEGWIGFDTCHAGDRWNKESYEAFGYGAEWCRGQELLFENQAFYGVFQENHWTVIRVRMETTELARQVAVSDIKIPYHATIWTSL